MARPTAPASLLLAGDVAGDDERLAAHRLDLRGGLRQPVCAARDERDIRAGLGEGHGDDLADAPGGPRHERLLAGALTGSWSVLPFGRQGQRRPD